MPASFIMACTGSTRGGAASRRLMLAHTEQRIAWTCRHPQKKQVSCLQPPCWHKKLAQGWLLTVGQRSTRRGLRKVQGARRLQQGRWRLQLQL